MRDIRIIKKSNSSGTIKKEISQNINEKESEGEIYQIIQTEIVELNIEDLKKRKYYLQSALRECNKQKERLKEWEESLIKELSQIEELIKSDGNNN